MRPIEEPLVVTQVRQDRDTAGKARLSRAHFNPTLTLSVKLSDSNLVLD